MDNDIKASSVIGNTYQDSITGFKGVCSAGTEFCRVGFLSCGSDFGPIVEICNGLDDDCDGQADETFDLANDPENCGQCGNQCSSGLVCNGGVCGPPAPDIRGNYSGFGNVTQTNCSNPGNNVTLNGNPTTVTISDQVGLGANIVVNGVPEPTTVLLIGLGIIGAAMTGRRKVA